MKLHQPLLAALVAGAALLSSGAQAQSVLKVVPHSNLSILDPIWTTAVHHAQPRLHDLRHLFGTGREGPDQAADGRGVET